ncbi:MAG: peptidase C1 [Lewinellaceae bacterium]|nr:peptidase C1 [Lewinellaceae bacterium]
MPIRMEQDSPQEPQQGGNRGGGGGLGGLIKWLPLLLLFVFKRPKLLIPLLLVGGFWYFFLGGQEMLSGGVASPDEINPDAFSLGASLSEERFDQAEVFEPLSYGSGDFNRLPARVNLVNFAPRPLHQGRQGSCVGWASAYAARTILQARATGADPNRVAFSPAYLYNQIHLDGCEGAYMLEAMKTMSANGGLPMQEFGYDDRTCANYPNNQQIAEGRQYRIKGYNRLTVGAENYKPDIMAIKQNLAQGAPVVIGAMVGGTFMNRMLGQALWEPTSRDYSMQGFGGHAMCVIGYDDTKAGGAFYIQNSWGEEWGDRGRAWVRYPDFEYFVREAYGLYPMGAAGEQQQFDEGKMAVEFGLLDVTTEQIIPLKQAGDIVFRSGIPLRAGQKFKVLIANSIECYMYVFGQETDGSSYVLFPYTEKHSAYCGITGTRLFPRDYSMVPDDLGNRDYIAVVISKKEIDFKAFNQRLNAGRGAYADRLKTALAGERVRTVSFKPGNTVAFSADVTKTTTAVGLIVEIDKQ